MIESIYNFKQLSSILATSGQPDEDELHEIAQSGFEVLINLGLSDAEYSQANEKNILNHYGVDYFHLPVNFQTPEIKQYQKFSQIFNSVLGKKIFVHCAANKRVSVFIALYQVIELNLPLDEARQNIQSIWLPNEVWENFISQVLTSKT